MVIKYWDKNRDILFENIKDLNKLFRNITADRLIINNEEDNEEIIKNIIYTLEKDDTLIIKNIGSLGNNIHKALGRAIILLNKEININILDINLELRYDDEEKIKLLKSLLKDCTYYNLDKLII